MGGKARQSLKVKCIAGAVFAAASVTEAPAADSNDSNLDLVYRAQGQYQQLMAGAANGYSARLQSLETWLNAYAGRNGLETYSKIVILDPIKADVGLALGLNSEMIARSMLLEKGVAPYRTFSGMLGDYLVSPVPTMTDSDSYTQNPHALFVIFNDARKGPCTIVPSPENSIPAALVIPGLHPSEALEFRNRHEGWHCLDNTYFNKPVPAPIYEAKRNKDLSVLAGNDRLLTGFLTLHKAEILADVGALGDMIRFGGKIDLIDRIIEWRAGMADDLIHLSAPVLKEFKDRIAGMGVDRFVAMTEAEARTLYYTVTEDFALDQTGLEALIAAENHSAPADPVQGVAGIERYRDYMAAPKAPASMMAAFTAILGGSGITESDVASIKAVSADLKNWSPLDALQDKAFALAGKVTPVSIVKAYIALQGDYNARTAANPDKADLYIEMATRLKSVFVEKTMWLDYGKINAQYNQTGTEKGTRQFMNKLP